jgi:SAM-dependent methyltransferase
MPPLTTPQTPAHSGTYQQQSNYFAKAKYRAANDPVVAAYVLPKLNFIETVVPLAKSSVLDIGCGNGVFTLYLKDRCQSVMGVDFSSNMLAENPCRGLIQADVATLPLPAGSFDATFEANVLHHVDSPRDVVLEMARVARRWVVLIEPNRYNPGMFACGLFMKEERAVLKSHARGLQKLLESCGLTVRLSVCTGMISQNQTPEVLVPLLRFFDGRFALGEYVIVVAEKAPRLG